MAEASQPKIDRKKVDKEKEGHAKQNNNMTSLIPADENSKDGQDGVMTATEAASSRNLVNDGHESDAQHSVIDHEVDEMGDGDDVENESDDPYNFSNNPYYEEMTSKFFLIIRPNIYLI